ncbi:MAG: twin-arginine translocase TatA/TatE family subunit [Muribaculaceae bacterium]|nr:twin-arginine translocase TatA/TatE family subunit [Muribaculaceae bacterium]
MTVLLWIPAFLGNIRGAQLIIIILVVLLLFGGKKIPELMRGLGKGVHAFRQGLADAKEEIEKPVEKPSGSSDSESQNKE